MSFIARTAVVLCVATAVFSTGCRNNKKTDASEEAWVVTFKKELARTEKRFFEQRYIQKQEDPFYLREVLPKIAPDTPISVELQAQIDLRCDDYNESWPILTEQLERTQLIFAITSVLPAFQATKFLAQANSQGVDTESAAMILQFKAMVERGTVFDNHNKRLELSPATKSDVVELAGKIAVRTLALIKKAGLSGDAQTRLERLRDEIRLLNPKAAELAGEPVSEAQVPHIEEPFRNWAELKGVYDEIFKTLTTLERVGQLKNEQAKVKAAAKPSAKLKNQLAQIEAELASNREKLAAIPALQAKETRLLQKVIFTTEKQFKQAGVFTK